MRVARRARDRARKLRWPMTRCETILWTRLRRDQLMGMHFRKQHPVGPYIADFACVKARLLVEVDGETHWSVEQRRRDARRTAFLEREGWTVLRVWNDDVYRNEQGVVETIAGWAVAGMEARVEAPSLRSGASGRCAAGPLRLGASRQSTSPAFGGGGLPV